MPPIPPSKESMGQAITRLNAMAGKLDFNDAVFLRYVARDLLPLVPVREDDKEDDTP